MARDPVADVGPAHRAGDRTRDSGSAVVDFVLVGALTTVMLSAVLQLAVALHVRNTLIDCAAEGARYGALAGQDPGSGAVRTRDLITQELSARYATDVTSGRAQLDGLDTVEVRVRAPLPLAGLLGAPRLIVVSGHAVTEAP